MNRFISGLMKKMTLEEKVGQLSQCSGGFATGPDNTRISRTEDISKGIDRFFAECIRCCQYS